MSFFKKVFKKSGLGAIVGALTGLALAPFTGGQSLWLTAGALGAAGAASGAMQGYEEQKQENLAKEAQEKEMVAASAQTPAYQEQDAGFKTVVQKRRGLASTVLAKAKPSRGSGKTTTA